MTRGVVVAAVVSLVLVASAPGDRTVRVNLAADGSQGNLSTFTPSITPDGRYVVFTSFATNLVPGDTNDIFDVFVRDRRAGTTERVSVSSTGAQPNEQSNAGRITPDGRYVVFNSFASNLVPGDTNETSDMFVRDRTTGQTSRVSVTSAGEQADGFSSFSFTISPDGRYVLFDSEATNLVPGDTNGVRDIFQHDRLTGRTTRVSVADDGSQANHYSEAPTFSADGRYLAFMSWAGNLVPGDTNGFSDVFVRDLRTGRTTLVSRNPAGAPSRYGGIGPVLSADGRFVAYQSESPDVVPGDTNGMADCFVRDLRAGRTELVSVSTDGRRGNDHCNSVTMTPDGRYVLFSSGATTLVPGDRNGQDDIFVRDRTRRTTTRVNTATFGEPADGWSGAPSVTADGRVIAFLSDADNLVPGDTNQSVDVFLRVPSVALGSTSDR